MVLFAAALLGSTTAALSAQRSIGIAAGRAAIREYNQLASPLNYAGGATSLSFGYFADGAHTSWGVQIEAQLAALTPSQNDVGSRASADRFSLSVPVLRQIAGNAERANVRIGAALVADMLYRNHEYGRGTADEPYADAFAGFDAIVRGGLRFGATRAQLDVAASAMRIAWRTPYAGLKYVPTAELALPDRYRGVDADLLLVHPLSTRWSWTAGLRWSALSDAGEWSLQHGARQVSLGLRHDFRGPVQAHPVVVEAAREHAR